MKGQKRRSLIVSAIFVFVGFFLSGQLYAIDEKTAVMIEQSTRQQTEEKRQEVLQEATSAIGSTQKALKALDEGDKKKALADLEKASGKLDIILARQPELALAPADVDTVTYDVLATVEDVNRLKSRAEQALEDGRVQKARALIDNLASEKVISVTNIPLATYPGAIALAANLIDNDQVDEAKSTLQTALNTLVVNEYTFPLPVLNARAELEKAEQLAEKSGRSKKENKRLAGLLDESRKELKMAEALGYGDKSTFEKMYQQLSAIEKKTAGGKHGSGFFDSIKNKLEGIFEDNAKGHA